MKQDTTLEFNRQVSTSGNSSGKPAMGRRAFLRKAGAITGLTVASTAVQFGPLSKIVEAQSEARNSAAAGAEVRRDAAFRIRVHAAATEKRLPPPVHPDNGDEALYPSRIGNFSKGLPHNSMGEVDASAYRQFLKATATGSPAQFAAIPLGGSARLINPQAGLAFDLEGTDSHQLAIPPAPALASAWRAAEAVEDYWMALMRDVSFADFATDPLAQAAITDLNRLSDFRGPRDNHGAVTSATLFRGFTPADLIGPYVSQFLYPTLQYGAAEVVQRFQTYFPIGGGGSDYLTTFTDWMSCQNGQGPFGANSIDPVRRYVRNGRDLAAYVHIDVLFEAYFNACLYLIDSGAPFNPGNPYISSTNQLGFGTFGAPHVKALVAEVATRALKAVWYQKWFVHRTLRPEAYGGLVHLTMTGTQLYPLHADVLDSPAVAQAFSNYGSYLLPMAFPEGCPQHPSYGAGHATVAGACATIVKAFFDETFVLPNPVVPSADGVSLVPYTGSDAGQITVGGEMNKVAANIAIGRNHAGVHWRSDYQESLKLGEAIAISVLRDQRATYNEEFDGFTFTRFDGTQITI
jgi:hypothetical protein